MPLIGSTITPIVVFLPLIAITGVTGVFFRALAVTVTVSLLTSLALALSWTPTLEPVSSSKSAEGLRVTRDQPPAVENGSERDDAANCWPPKRSFLSGFFLQDRRLSTSAGCGLRSGAAPCWLAIFSGVADRRLLPLLQAFGNRPAAGDGRRRIRHRLHHARRAVR